LDKILVNGAAISEMPFTRELRAHHFSRRHRLISGLSFGVVVGEAARRSGSLITARFAGEQGREVFAVPGSPLDPRSEGTNGLLKQGATPVTDAADVIAITDPIRGQGINVASAGEAAQPPLEPSDIPIDGERTRLMALLGRDRYQLTIWCDTRIRPRQPCAACCCN